MAAIHGDDIIAEGEPKDLDRLDEVLKKLVLVKVLDRVGPRATEHGQYLKRHIAYMNGQGFEWLEDPKHLAAIIRNRSKVGVKPQSSPGARTSGKAIQKRWTSLKRWKDSRISKIQASVFTCPVEDSTFSSA